MSNGNFWRAGTAGLLTAATLLPAGPASALGFQLGEFDISLESSLTAGLAMRTEDADKELIGKSNLANAVDVDSSFVGAYSTNGDDGNQAFSDSGDLFFGQIKLSSDLTIQVGDWGVFARGNYRYDPIVKNETLFDDFDYGPNRSRTQADRRARQSAAEDAAGDDGELFDLYLFGNFKIGDRAASLRIGRQVLNWGESTFIANGINSIVPVDARQARGPGAEVKEIFRPFGMVWGSMELVRNISIEAFYQFGWEGTIIDPSGTYFSTSDFLGAGAADVQIGFGRCNENILPTLATQDALRDATGNPNLDIGARAGAPTCDDAAGGTNVPELAANEPEDGGQYGVRLNFFIEALNSTDLSLYAINYHSRLPLLSGVNVAAPGVAASGGGFLREYPEDIELYGISFNSFLEFGEIAVQGEYSLHKDQPLQIDDVELLLYSLGIEQALAGALGGPVSATTVDDIRGPFVPGAYTQGYERFDYHQWNLSFSKFIGPNWTGSDQIVLLGEFAGQIIDDLPDPDELPFEAAATYVPNQAEGAAALGLPAQDRAGYADDAAWGYRLVAAFRYLNVLNRYNLTPSIRYFHDVKGNSPAPISTFLEDRKQIVLGVNAEFLDAWEAGLSYTMFLDSQDTAAAPIDPATQAGQRISGYSSNVVEDRDFVNLFLRYNF